MTLFTLPVTVENLRFMMLVGIHRLIFSITGKSNPISDPYLSGDSFRAIADYVFDEKSTFNPKEVSEKSIVFVCSPKLKEFFENIHPLIQHKYVLISHNGDVNIDESFLKYIDQKIIHWFAQNVFVHHSKLTPLPIGLENLDFYNHGVPSFFENLRRLHIKKISQIVYGFSISTNPKERTSAFKYISRHPLSKMVTERLNAFAYLKFLNNFQFVLSPPGNGEDCMRTWEAMYLGVIPIVRKSELTTYFKSLGLPIWVVNSWIELDDYDSSKLQKKYQEILTTAKLDSLYIPYWKDRIRSCANNG